MRPEEAASAFVKRYGLHLRAPVPIERLACAEGMTARPGDTGSADAYVVRTREGVRITIAERDWGRPRGRFSLAHELAHPLIHPDQDEVARIHGLSRREARHFALEWEADEWARHVLVPHSIAAPMCRAAPPDFARVLELAETFDVSRSVAARRYPEMSPRSCAFVEAHAGMMKWVKRSATFRGDAVQTRPLPDGALALDLYCGFSRGERTRLHRVAWGAADAGVDIVEECWPLGGGKMLVWLWHA